MAATARLTGVLESCAESRKQTSRPAKKQATFLDERLERMATHLTKAHHNSRYNEDTFVIINPAGNTPPAPEFCLRTRNRFPWLQPPEEARRIELVGRRGISDNLRVGAVVETSCLGILLKISMLARSKPGWRLQAKAERGLDFSRRTRPKIPSRHRLQPRNSMRNKVAVEVPPSQLEGHFDWR